MSDPFLGEIRLFAFNFAPEGWFLCNGQTLAISQYTALFSLIGTYYGGNGTTTFQLPNLQSRVPIHQGTGTGLSTYVIGQQGGVESVTLNTNEIPSHNHTVTLSASAEPADTDQPKTATLASSQIYSTAAATLAMAAQPATAVSQTGGNQPHTNIQPYLCMNYCIAYTGIFPSRS